MIFLNTYSMTLKLHQPSLSRQFSEELELLVQDQRLTVEQWTSRQERMEERVQTLEAKL